VFIYPLNDEHNKKTELFSQAWMSVTLYILLQIYAKNAVECIKSS